MSADPPTTSQPLRDWSWLSSLLGLFASTWAVVILVPGSPDLPAWPAASVGLFALLAARLPGRAVPRGLGAFLGAIGVLVGITKIAALWGVLDLLQ